jgi:hypothetical protein
MSPQPANVPASPLADRRNPDHQHIVPGGRREWVLTLEEVATALKTDIRTIRKLIRLQREENAAARAEHRTPAIVGLHAVMLSERNTRVREEALATYLRHAESNGP